MAESPDRLIILEPGRVPPAGARISQRVSSRVLVLPADAAAWLTAADGVLAVLAPGDPFPHAARAGLSRAELIFVEAYLRKSQPKTRAGEGLAWDAEGFVPPDPTKRR